MGNVAIVTGLTAGLPAELVEELGIHVVPVPMGQDGQIFLDGVDIAPTEAYRQLRSGGKEFTTSAPSIPGFLEVYQAAAQGLLACSLSP
jgi:fatty acid-binding protein DegV